MKKIIPQTKDITSENINKIAQLFPQVITEKEDENGNTVKAIDFEALKQHLSNEIVEGSDERYRLDWPGKRASILKANTPINSTLKPDRESSVNFDTTENVYIEGDNFEVLKILQESYLGKIKMIYIDPPYNTGKDFVYKDNFKISKEDYEDEIGVEDEEGGKLFKNTDTNGRFHSDWLSMMYERLLVARDLLTDDGVIFMSIDDNEVHNLRKIADEVFGEENFVSEFIWEKKKKPSFLHKNVGKLTEYILSYTKKSEKSYPFSVDVTTKGKKYPLNNAGNSFSKISFPKGSVNFSFGDCVILPQDMSEGNIRTFLKTELIIENGTNKNEFILEGEWRYSQNKLNEIVSNKEEITISKIPFRPNHIRRGGDIKKMKNVFSPIHYKMETNEDASKQIVDILGFDAFDYTKPNKLMNYLIKSITYDKKNDLILDFFSGSATTAHATMQLNAEDGGNRKFIMVQLPEETDEKSEAYKAGYKYITEIGKERIRRAGKKIQEENTEQLKERTTPLDIGFRVYKTSESILKNVAKHPNEITQIALFESQDNIKETAKDEDILTAVLLDFGLQLDNPIETKIITGSPIFIVDENALVACFAKNIDMQVVDFMAKKQPIRAVFRDACFKDDKDLINTVESRFKQLAPNTKVHVI
ncbi:site-specific DNA-methyltransferase [Polaribacter atrinae]|uniref:site-specific DNA-methyltransferase n=1 Tax=Polaribacter atrinae TaxID=1333662 RepID=UPI002492ED22|nr:site-specific DNA-methyltransferase [Polaribacter atrinae]